MDFRLAASVPNITTIREMLDYGDAKLARCDVFYDDMRTFRKKYKPGGGLSGVDLQDWGSKEHQAGLTRMTEAYLDEGGNGSIFWPDDASPYKNKLRYSIDSPE
jgi:hypothetical protein